ncbi:hypothetical protein GQX73_g3091 [Xylaria multiplex]|uniref:Uncharacterized protein n=1 Tax=Xylaria multiplex TaxID=323545 RepID=A0A7C8MWY9_9PEZI|nr:hypothetical protein GQX73_g3091 [Xylaria multiplex]
MASPEGAKDMSTQVNRPEVVDFLKLLDAMVTHQSTTWISQVVAENEQMKTIVKQKEADNNTFVRTIAKVTNDRDAEAANCERALAQSNEDKAKADKLANEIDDAKKTIAEKNQKLEEEASTINSLKGNIETLGQEAKTRDDVIKKQEERHAKDNACIKELQATLGATKSVLHITSTQLKELQDFSCKVVDESKDFVLGEIDKIYGYARMVAFKFFTEDLPEETLINTKAFDEIVYLVSPIPMPASNSVHAKRVRIAAFLRLLGYRLADQIFIPFYMPHHTSNGNHNLPTGIDPFTLLLSNLSETDPRRELHLRSVLLEISPQEQREVALRKAADIADEIFSDMYHLVISSHHEAFLKEIHRVCELAVKSWDTLRSLKAKIEPFTVTEEDTEKYWLPVELENSGVGKKSQANGKPNGLGSKPSMHSLKSANKVTLIWPGFSYGSEVLKQGYMLLDSQVERAEEEARPSKRYVRAMQRAATGSPVPSSPRRAQMRKPKVLAGDVE